MKKFAKVVLLVVGMAGVVVAANWVDTPIKRYEDLQAAVDEKNKIKIKKLLGKGEAKELFIIAAKKGSLSIVKIIYKYGVDINAKDEDDYTALHWAAKMGHGKIVEFLLNKNGIEVNKIAPKGKTALFLAVENGQKGVAQALLPEEKTGKAATLKRALKRVFSIGESFSKIVDVNRPETDNQDTPLHVAARKGNLEIVDILLRNGATVDKRNSSMETALMVASEQGHEEEVEKLLEYKAMVNARDQAGNTALHKAARNGHKNVVENLLEAGAEVDWEDGRERIALHFAAMGGYVKIMESLLKKAHEQARKNAGESASNEAVEQAFKNILDAEDYFWETPLHKAARNGHAKVVNRLLGEGAAFDNKNKSKLTELHLAAMNGHGVVVKSLVENEADVNTQAEEYFDYKTPIELAIDYLRSDDSKKNIENAKAMVTFLVEKGADIGKCTVKKVKKPDQLIEAAKKGELDIVKALVEGMKKNETKWPNKELINKLTEASANAPCETKSVGPLWLGEQKGGHVFKDSPTKQYLDSELGKL